MIGSGWIAVVMALGLMLSFCLSGMEAGVFALSRLRVRQRMRSGDERARLLHRYLERPENFLWTILVGNTLASFLVISLGVLVLHGWLLSRPWLFVLALLTGFAVPAFLNQRMALAAHITGILNALILMALAACGTSARFETVIGQHRGNADERC